MTETERIGDLTLLRVMERALWQQQDIGLTVMEYKILLRLVTQRRVVNLPRHLRHSSL